jgi:hypothetical protein
MRYLREITQAGADFIHIKGEQNVIPDLQSQDPRYTGEWTEEE